VSPCAICGHPTRQRSVVVEDRLYPPCCLSCVMADKWVAISVASATPEQLASALRASDHARDRSVGTALIQWSADVLGEHRGFRKRPEGCRAWGS
jgi:hypothetical protein